MLGQADLPAVLGLLNQNPVENLFVASRVDSLGLDASRLGCRVWGYERDGRLVALCHAGANLVPIGADEEALAGFAVQLGERRFTQSIMGEASQVLRLHQLLVARCGNTWARSRDIRAHQQLLMIDRPPTGARNRWVRPVVASELDGYLTAAVRMYTEEVGVSPLDPSNSYLRYVSVLIATGRAFGWLRDGKVAFKSDIGAAYRNACQVQGVWLDPALRGRGLAVPAMATAVDLCQRQYPIVSLYVNDYNTRALRTYADVGFRQVGEFATVLY